MRTIDISDIANGNISESGFFDSYPANDNTGYNGTWNVYPFFASGNIIISGSEGFFLVKDSSLGLEDNTMKDFVFAPNPATSLINIDSNATNLELSIYDLLGRKLFSQKATKQIDVSWLEVGTYIVQLTDGIETSTRKLIKN